MNIDSATEKMKEELDQHIRKGFEDFFEGMLNDLRQLDRKLTDAEIACFRLGITMFSFYYQTEKLLINVTLKKTKETENNS